MNFDLDSLPRIALFFLQANLVWSAGCAAIFLALKSTSPRQRYPMQLALLFILPVSILVALAFNLPAAKTITEPLTVSLYAGTVLQEAVNPPLDLTTTPLSLRYLRLGIVIVSALALIGFALLAGGFWNRLRRLFQLAGETHPGIQDHLNHLADGLGLKQQIRLFIAKLNISPFSYGIGKPRIVIPDKLLQVLSSKDLDLVLRHEVHHIQRRDFLINVFQKGIRIAFFYNPVVHWLDRRIELDREVLCDRAVLESSQCSKREYAELLVRVAEFVNQHPHLSPQVTFHSKQSHLRRRLSHMKTNNISHPTPWRTGFTLFTLLASFVAVSLTGYGADGEKKKQKKAKKERFSLEISNDELTIRRNGEAHRFDKDSEEYRALMAQYKRLLRQVEPGTPETPHDRAPNENRLRSPNPYAVAPHPNIAQGHKIHPPHESVQNTKQIRRQESNRDAFAQSSPPRQGQQRRLRQSQNSGQVGPFRPAQSQQRDVYRERQIRNERERVEQIRRLEAQLAHSNAKLANRQNRKDHPENESQEAQTIRRLDARTLAEIQDRQRRTLEKMERELAEHKKLIEHQHKLLEQQLKRQQDQIKRERQIAEDRQLQMLDHQKKLQDELHKKATQQQRRAYELERRLEDEALRAVEQERRANEAEQRARKEAREAMEHERKVKEEHLRAREETRRAIEQDRRAKESERRALHETQRALEQARRAKEQDLRAKRQEDRMARLRQELVEAQVIDPAGEVLNIELTDNHLKVNGKIQSEDLHKRAKQIFGDTSDRTIKVETKIQRR